MYQIKRAIIVAAGEGSRLRPVSLSIPKPLVKVNGVRIIDTIISALKTNGIHEIYIVSGYKSEQFFEVYKDDLDITVIENPHYLDGNNVTSLYMAKDFIPESFIIEGDLRIINADVLNPTFDKSGYLASYVDQTNEWVLKLKDGIIDYYNKTGGEHCYRLWGVSMWNRKDGEKLAELVRHQVEDIKDWNKYWDELVLPDTMIKFGLGIRTVNLNDIVEIDTYDELVAIDSSYKSYHISYNQEE